MSKPWDLDRPVRFFVSAVLAGVLVAGLILGIRALIIQDDHWDSWCHAQGGHVISGRSGDLCVKNGLIIGSN